MNQVQDVSAAARERAWDYMTSYRSGSLMKQAEAEGWAYELEQYAYESAWLQAQYALNVPNPGFSSMALFSTNQAVLHLRRKTFVETCRRNGMRGMIDVAVPSEMIAKWREIGQRRKAAPPEPDVAQHAARTFSTVPPPKTQLELYIEQQLAEMESRA